MRIGTPHRSSKLGRRVVACLAVAVLVGACGDDDDDSSDAATTTTTPGDAVCSDSEALQSSIAGLTSLDVSAEGTNALESALADVKDDLSELRSSVSEALQPQVQAVQDGVEDLETAVGDLGSGGASDVRAAISTVSSAVATLVDSLDEGACD